MPLSTVLPASGLLPAAQAGGLLYREGGLHPRAYGPYRPDWSYRSYRPDWSYRSYRPDWSYRSYRPDWSYRQRRDC